MPRAADMKNASTPMSKICLRSFKDRVSVTVLVLRKAQKRLFFLFFWLLNVFKNRLKDCYQKALFVFGVYVKKLIQADIMVSKM